MFLSFVLSFFLAFFLIFFLLISLSSNDLESESTHILLPILQGPGDIELRQMAEDMRRIKSSGNPIEASKTLTLSPQSAEWMRGKSEFCHQIARLAKFWAQTIIFDKKVFGMSYIFELIAVKAALEEEARGGTLTAMFVAAFHRFLTKVGTTSDSAWL